MQAASGNTNDHEGFKQIVKHHLSSMKAAQSSRYFIGDSALYVAETIQSLAQQGQLFISRAPQKLKAVRQAISEQHTLNFIQLENGYSGAWLKMNYGGVEQRWLLVHSEQAQKSELKTLDKKMLRESNAASKSFKKLTSQRFSCPSDAVGALAIWEKANPCIEVSDVDTNEHGIFKQSGRPKKGQKPDSVEYQLTGNLSSSLALRAEKLQQKGFFMLATNDLSESLTMEKMLELYKSQQSVEGGFRFLKSPDFLTSSLYLKKPERIEALLMVMTCCLMIYAALEYKIRQELEAQEAYFPDLKYKPSQRPTARWVFLCFQGIEVLKIKDEQERELVLNLKKRNRTIIDCLGSTYQLIYY